jgi:hypothetical protein
MEATAETKTWPELAGHGVMKIRTREQNGD